jgi:surface polysaccharide O-acyltransferase-like enzyme
MEKPADYYWIDVVRIIAILQVIIIHVSARLVYYPPSFKVWIVASSYDTLSRPGVPLFIMISGALLLDRSKVEGAKVLFQKRILKIVIPLIAWSFIYAIFVLHQSYDLAGIWLIIKQIYSGQVMFHLLFMYIILGLYLVIPIFKIYTDNASLKNKLYFLALWFFAVAIAPTIGKLYNLDCGIFFTIVTGFIGYYLLGLLLKKNDVAWSTYKKIRVSILFIILCYLIGEMGVYYLIERAKIPDEFFYQYLAPNIIVMSVAVLFLIKTFSHYIDYACEKSLIMKTTLTTFREITYGIYFVHVIVLFYLRDHLHFSANSFNPLFSIPIVSMVILVISALLMVLIKNTPILRNILV